MSLIRLSIVAPSQSRCPSKKANALLEIVSSGGLMGNVEDATKFMVLEVVSVGLQWWFGGVVQIGPGLCPTLPLAAARLPSLD